MGAGVGVEAGARAGGGASSRAAWKEGWKTGNRPTPPILRPRIGGRTRKRWGGDRARMYVTARDSNMRTQIIAAK